MSGLRHLGPFVPNYPLAKKGDTTHVIVSQPFEVPASEYVPDALNTTRVFSIGGADKTLYFLGDTPSSSSDQKFQRFVRRWGNVPASWDDYESHAAQFPGLIATNQTTVGYNGGANYFERTWNYATYRRKGFVRKVTSKITFDYFRVTGTTTDLPNKLVATPADIPLIPVQEYSMADKRGYGEYTIRSPLEMMLSDVDTLTVSNVATFVNMLTVPTRTEYFALGTYGLVLSCDVGRYEGNIFYRATRKVTPI